MFVEEDTVLISALEHYSYCPRQCGLIHVERIFDENVFTLRGRHGHERTDTAGTKAQNGVRVERGLPIWSDRLGLRGKADVVEFFPDGTVVPVEYKHGTRRNRQHDDVQLCAQVLCLEEMLGITIARGAIYSLQTHRRRTVVIDQKLRENTIAIIDQVRALIKGPGPLPPAVADKRCPRCSLIDACVPTTVVAARHARLTTLLYSPLVVDISDPPSDDT